MKNKSKLNFYLSFIIPDFLFKNYLINSFFRFFLVFYRKKIRKIILEEENTTFLIRLKRVIPLNSSINDISDLEKCEILKEADEILKGNYSFLGVEKIDFTNVNWHKDYKSSFIWQPNKYYKKYVQVDLNNDADVKIPRELSRSHHILKVAIAYNSTKDKKYSQFVVDQLINWIDENPLMYSINWGCSMDVAIRAINWIWSLALISESNINDLMLNKIRTSIYEHGWFIYRNLEGNALTYNNNHFLSNLTGLIFIGSIFSYNEESKTWLNYAKYSFYREIRLQILPSGMSFERSFHYHRLVLELILWPILLLQSTKENIPQDIWKILENMFDFLFKTCKPDGTIPNVGDQDNGRVLPFGNESINDFRYLFSIGGVLFKRKDMLRFSKGFNVYCSQLISINHQVKSYSMLKKNNKNYNSLVLSDAGFFVFREKNNFLLFNIQSKGGYVDSFRSSIHTHADLFSFELFINNHSVIIDPGTYVYTSDKEFRNVFRGTRMHNTVLVDNENQEKLNENILFEMTRNAKVKVDDYYENENKIFLSATHSAYKRLSSPVFHTRNIEYFKDNSTFIIRDKLFGKGSHAFEVLFHFAENIDLDIMKKNSVKVFGLDIDLALSFKSNSKFEIKLEPTFISKSYGDMIESKLLSIKSISDCPFELETLIKSN